jgi:hypothetical protein
MGVPGRSGGPRPRQSRQVRALLGDDVSKLPEDLLPSSEDIPAPVWLTTDAQEGDAKVAARQARFAALYGQLGEHVRRLSARAAHRTPPCRIRSSIESNEM